MQWVRFLIHIPKIPASNFSSEFYMVNDGAPMPVATRSKAWVCGRWFAGVSGSSPAGGMEVALL